MRKFSPIAIGTSLFVVSAMWLIAASSGAAGPLRRAWQNEREAEARYLAFASKAVEEGYPGAASLFRASARAEAIHAARFAELLKARGGSLELEVNEPGPIASTEGNIRVAINGERSEVQGLYLELRDKARETGDQEAYRWIELARTTEIEHLNLYSMMLQDSSLMKQAKTFHVCTRCGYTTDVALRFCPACRTGHLAAVE